MGIVPSNARDTFWEESVVSGGSWYRTVPYRRTKLVDSAPLSLNIVLLVAL